MQNAPTSGQTAPDQTETTAKDGHGRCCGCGTTGPMYCAVNDRRCPCRAKPGEPTPRQQDTCYPINTKNCATRGRWTWKAADSRFR